MNRFFSSSRSWMAGCLVLIFASISFSADKTKYQLPKNPKAVVISFDWKGGFTPPRKNNAPVLSILRDGTVLMPARFGIGKDITGKISQAELQELLHYAIATNKFFDYNAKAVKAKIEKAKRNGKRLIQIADAPHSEIVITTAKKTNKANQYALSFTASQFKTVTELQQLSAIEKRLRRVMNVTRVGGPKEVKKTLALANAALKKQYPKVRPVTVENFQSAYVNRNGTLRISFLRRGRDADGKNDGTYVNIFIETSASGKPKITIRVKLK